ncbi:MAG: dihydrofolate reductase family protein [Chloroflexi bacterium]|nr:dihydrofolate reductase family protein [Chloroflexota bacterium]
MKKIVVSEGVSLDGVFEAQTMGQWAQPFSSDEKDEHVRELILESDALLLGRTTYDGHAYYWPSLKNNEYGIADRMNSMSKYVVTSTPLQTQWNNSTIINGNVVEEIARLKQQPGQNILIQGSATLVEALMQADLIDEYHFMVHPVIVGSGKRFFKDGMGMSKLKLVESKPINHGIVVMSYEPTGG